MSIIGIDPSLVSTAMTIDGKHFFNYTKESYAHNKSGLSKWYKICEEFVEYRWIDYIDKEDFTDSEVEKLSKYDKLSNMIINDIVKYSKGKIIIAVEGYSYSSAAGPLIDLVTFGTLLRSKLFNIANEITILPPSTLKLKSAMLTYKGEKKGKKMIYRNNEGVAGGNFSKHDMYRSLIENEDLNTKWVKFLRQIKDDVFSSKTIKKPIEDVVDSYLLYEVIKNDV